MNKDTVGIVFFLKIYLNTYKWTIKNHTWLTFMKCNTEEQASKKAIFKWASEVEIFHEIWTSALGPDSIRHCQQCFPRKEFIAMSKKMRPWRVLPSKRQIVKVDSSSSMIKRREDLSLYRRCKKMRTVKNRKKSLIASLVIRLQILHSCILNEVTLR